MRGWLSGQMFESVSRAVDVSRCVNLIPQIIPEPPKSHASARLIFYGLPGILQRYSIGQGPIRGIYESNGRCFAVSGPKLFELFKDFTSLDRVDLANDLLPVTIDSNRFQLAIASANEGYIYDLATNTLVDVGVPLAQIRFADGYFIGQTPTSQMIRISGQYDGLTWDPLDFASAEADPDDIVAILTAHREIWTFGSETIEPWADSGAQAFPFERIPGALIEQGCAAAASPCKLDNSIFWLGADSRGQGIVWRATGYTPQRVSNHALEYQMSKFPTISDAIGFPYQDQGQTFYVLSFPAADRAFSYDCSTDLWHERATWDYANSLWHRHRGQVHAFAFGMHLLGDKDTGLVYEQNQAYFTDNGAPQKWLRSVPLAFEENKYLYPKNIELDIEVGLGVA